MDPVTALGLAANILAFLDFSWNVVTGTYEVYKSAVGVTSENASINVVVTDLADVTNGLTAGVDTSNKHGKALAKLADDCQSLSSDLLKILKKLQVTGKNTRWRSMKVKLASLRREKEVTSIERRLHDYRLGIILRLNLMLNDQHSSIKIQLESVQADGQRLSKESATQFSSLRQAVNDMIQSFSQTMNQKDAPSSNVHVAESLTAIRSSISELLRTSKSLSRENCILQLLYFDSLHSRGDTVADAEAGTFARLLQENGESMRSSQVSSSGDSESSAYSDEDIRSRISNHSNNNEIVNKDGGGFTFDDAQSHNEQEALESNDDNASEAHFDSPAHTESDEDDHSDFSGSSQEARLRKDTRDAFLTWLAYRHGVYHISGKAGSGKSTLMKFVSQHSRVRSELGHWAARKKLVLARFFFWSAGDQLQRSLEGLYRSILFEVLSQCPELIPRVFPEEWTESEIRHDTVARQSLRLPEVKAAFNRLIGQPQYLAHRICLFIDGLDEYDGDSVQHWELAQSIETWGGSDDVKICVSSRPHVEFMQTFSDDITRRICLHEVTAPDIRLYAKEMFKKDANFERIRGSYLDFVKEIVENADGVFSWAVLVVRGLLDGVGHRYSDSALRKRLENTPKNLGLLFKSLLDRIDQSDREKANRMLLLTLFCAGKHYGFHHPNALVYDWLDDLENPDFPFTSPLPEFTDEEFIDKYDRLSCQLDGMTKGLLELSPLKNSHVFARYTVQFFHRTVKDFFHEHIHQIKVTSPDPRFPSAKDYLRLCLAEFRFALAHLQAKGKPMDVDTLDIVRLCHLVLRHDKNIEQAFLWDILNGFDNALASRPEGHEISGETYSIDLLWYSKGKNFSYLHFLATRGLHQYVIPRTQAAFDLLKSKGPLNLLLSAAVSTRPELVELLLKKSRNPNEPVQSIARRGQQALVGTVWLFFLLCFVQCKSTKARSDGFMVMETFLRFGADRNVLILMYLNDVGEIQQPGSRRENPSQQVLFYLSLEHFVRLLKPQNSEAILILLSENRFTHFWTQARRTVSSWVGWDHGLKVPESTYKPFKGDSLHEHEYSLHSICSRDMQVPYGTYIRLF